MSNTKSKSDKPSLISEIKKYRQSYMLMAPFTIIFLVFTIIPVVVAIYFSFTYYNILQPPTFVGLENYMKLFFNDDIFALAVQNTIVFAVITGPVGYFMCLITAWLLNELKPKVRAFLTLLFFAPSLAGGAAIWTLIFHSDRYGYLNSFLLNFNLIDAPILWFGDAKYLKGALIVVILWGSLGVSFLAFVANLQSVDRSLYEAAAIDGIKNRFQELWYVTLPSMKGTLMFGAIISITGAFNIGAVITQYCGFPSPGYAAHTVMHHMEDYGGMRFEMGYASAISVLLFAIMIIANKVVQKLITKVGS